MAKEFSKGSGKPIPRVEVDLRLSGGEAEELLKTLERRFQKNTHLHPGLEWPQIRTKLEAQPAKLSSLKAMETTGGEPDVIGVDSKSGEYLFCDCAEESPSGRRSICYDGPGEKERTKKGLIPGGNAVELAKAMGVELLDEEQYRALQALAEFDTKTQSWIQTPAEIRELGGALFADRRYNQVFVYHNSAPSFYGSRGFRGLLRV